MKRLQACLAALLAALLVAACGHAYEGEFKAELVSDNKLFGEMAKMVNALGVNGQGKILIGSDYTIADGVRKDYDKIFERKIGQQRYLVFKNGNEEEAWKIIDADTLLIDSGFLQVRFVRVAG